MKYKIAIFDLDGTILNTLDDLADSLNVVLQKFQMPLHTYEQVRFMVGNGIPKLIERAIPDGVTNPKYQEVLSEYIKYYEKHRAQTCPQDCQQGTGLCGRHQSGTVSHPHTVCAEIYQALQVGLLSHGPRHDCRRCDAHRRQRRAEVAVGGRRSLAPSRRPTRTRSRSSRNQSPLTSPSCRRKSSLPSSNSNIQESVL